MPFLCCCKPDSRRRSHDNNRFSKPQSYKYESTYSESSEQRLATRPPLARHGRPVNHGDDPELRYWLENLVVFHHRAHSVPGTVGQPARALHLLQVVAEPIPKD